MLRRHGMAFTVRLRSGGEFAAPAGLGHRHRRPLADASALLVGSPLCDQANGVQVALSATIRVLGKACVMRIEAGRRALEPRTYLMTASIPP